MLDGIKGQIDEMIRRLPQDCYVRRPRPRPLNRSAERDAGTRAASTMVGRPILGWPIAPRLTGGR